MNNPILLLKFSYIIGAILDVLVALQMFFPETIFMISVIGVVNPNPAYLYASYMSGVMMIGWATLLLWGYMRPVERMDILLITSFPVVVGLMINDVFSVMSGFLPWLTAMVYLVIQVFLIIIFSGSYYLNRKGND